MRVLWMIDSLGPGGAESLMPTLLKDLRGQGAESRVCVLRVRAGNPIAAELVKAGIEVDLIPVRNLRNLSALGRIIKYMREYHPDVVHTQLETSDILGTLAARYLNIPSVSTIHTLEMPNRKFKKYWRNWLHWNCLEHLANKVIVVSEATRHHYARQGFKDAKLTTIYNGIDAIRFQKNEEERNAKTQMLAIPEESKVITTVAVLREAKGIIYMLEALPAILKEIPQTYYVIAGDGDQRIFLESASKLSGIAGHVIFLGHRKNIAEILAASDLFVYPTLRDALPTALFEAMAAGVPIVASQVGGVPEIVENNVSGLLVPPADPKKLAQACTRLLTDPELAKRLSSEACRTVLQRFDVRRHSNELLKIYEEVMKRHGR
jgi:glycosyltransferase involved in cell wall biosynthesis